MPSVALDRVVVHDEQDGDVGDGRTACVVLHGGLGFDHTLCLATVRRWLEEHGLP